MRAPRASITWVPGAVGRGFDVRLDEPLVQAGGPTLLSVFGARQGIESADGNDRCWR